MRVQGPNERPFFMPRGEVAVGAEPRIAPLAQGAAQRLRAFAGRALTAPVMEAEQNARSRRISWLNRTLSAGVVEGLECDFTSETLALAGGPAPASPQDPAALAMPRTMLLAPGLALTAAGEEMVIARGLQFDLLDVQVAAPAWLLEGGVMPSRPAPVVLPRLELPTLPRLPLGGTLSPGAIRPVGPATGGIAGTPIIAPGTRLGTVLRPLTRVARPEPDARRIGASLRELIRGNIAVPPAGVLVLQPIELREAGEAESADPCCRAPEDEAFEDQLRVEGARLVFYAWPAEWLELPAPGATWRNRLAHGIFEREAELGGAARMPWHEYGVPVALVAFDTNWRPLFADRAAVKRAGGRPLPSPSWVSGRGDRFLWQARIDQLAEHLVEARSAGAATIDALRAQFVTLPPAGLLPADALSLRPSTNRFFPASWRVDAIPVPLEQLDLVLEESASLAPYEVATADSVNVLVPVPQTVWERGLLVIEQPDHATFQATIARFVDARADWLRRRQNVRTKLAALAIAIDGPDTAAGRVPAPEDDPQRMEPETLAPATATPIGSDLHRSPRAAGYHAHALWKTPALALQAGDRLYAWVWSDREAAPAQIRLAFHSGAADNPTGWAHRAVWAAEDGVDGSEGVRIAAVPDAGLWTRLEVPVETLGLAGQSIDGMEFGVADGGAVWGAGGVLRAGAETGWFNAGLLKAAGVEQLDLGEAWDVVPAADNDAPTELAYGTEPDAAGLPKRVVSRLTATALNADGRTKRLGDFGEFPKIGQLGLRRYCADLAQRLDKADDVVNTGFLKVQTDLYRLRQSVLKQTSATRLAVSPALAQIAKTDSATASRQQVSQFYESSKKTRAVALAKGAPQPKAGTAMFAAGLQVERFDATRSTAITVNTTAPVQGFPLFTAEPAPFVAQFEGAGALAPPPRAASDLLAGADALIGRAEIRTTSIAARLEQPKSVESKNFASSTRFEVIRQLTELDVDIDDLDVVGLPEFTPPPSTAPAGTPRTFLFDETSGQPKRNRAMKVSAFRIREAHPTLPGRFVFKARADLLNLELNEPSPQRVDESAYFMGGVDLSDYTVAFLRACEGRIEEYRAGLKALQEVLAELDALVPGAGGRLAAIGRELAEARQDVATARALYAEDIERVRKINERRDALIAEHVRFLAYARPRNAVRIAGLPEAELDSSLEPDAVPACLMQHDDAPAEVEQMLEVLRRAPADWFVALRPLLPRFDKPELILRALDFSRLRLADAPRALMPVAAIGALAPIMAAARSVVAMHAQNVTAVRAAAAQLATPRDSVLAQIQHAAQVLSVADLLEAQHGRADVTKATAAEIERIGNIAACLHDRLSRVRPAIRLQWAELYSQFDRPGDLGDLTRLPRFDELTRDEREDIQGLARWLRARVRKDEARAVALMNDLVRVCLLVASHSPTNEIVSGRLLRPMPLRPGVLIPIRPLIPERVKIGMAVHLFHEDAVAGRAIVQDVVGGIAQVQVVSRTTTTEVTLSEQSKVQFVAGAAAAFFKR